MTALESSSPPSLVRGLRGVSAWAALRIRALVGDLAASAPQDEAWDALILLNEESVEVHARQKGAVKHLATLGSDIDAAGALKRQLGHWRRKRLVLRLGTGRAIRTAMTLPASAVDVLPAIVANKIESIAPWPASEALWGFRRRSERAGDVVEVDVAVASRKAVDGWVNRLAAAGLRVTRVEAGESAGRGDGISLGGFGAGAISRSLHRLKAAAVVAAAVALCVAAPGIYLLLGDWAELDRVTLRTAALQSELQGRARGSGQSPQFQQALALVERKTAEVPFITILKVLTSSLPDGTWVESLDFADSQLTFTGKGTPSPEVIETLELSPVLSRVGFAAATQREAGANVDSFSISASIETAGAPP